MRWKRQTPDFTLCDTHSNPDTTDTWTVTSLSQWWKPNRHLLLCICCVMVVVSEVLMEKYFEWFFDHDHSMIERLMNHCPIWWWQQLVSSVFPPETHDKWCARPDSLPLLMNIFSYQWPYFPQFQHLSLGEGPLRPLPSKDFYRLIKFFLLVGSTMSLSPSKFLPSILSTASLAAW